METPTPDVTILLKKLTSGDQRAQSELMSAVYDELRRLAASYMRRERPDHTLQATALVHEAYLKLVQQRSVDWRNRAHFYGVAAQLMRRILVDHARARLRNKRGGAQQKVSLDEPLLADDRQAGALVELHEALNRLADLDPRQSKIVELRFFGGLTVEETAEVLGISPKTVKRDWAVARAWLYGNVATGNTETDAAPETGTA